MKSIAKVVGIVVIAWAGVADGKAKGIATLFWLAMATLSFDSLPQFMKCWRGCKVLQEQSQP